MGRKAAKIEIRVVVQNPSDTAWTPLPDAYYSGARSVGHAASLIAASEGFRDGLKIRIMVAASGEVRQYVKQGSLAVKVPTDAL